MLKIEFALQYTYSCTSLIHIPILKPIGDENSNHCLWFLLCSKSSMLCSIPIVYTLLMHIPIIKTYGWWKLRAPSLVSAMLKIEHVMQYTYSYTLLMHIPTLKPIGDENSEHCLWFLPCSKSSMLCSLPIVILHLCIYPNSNLLAMKTHSTVSGFCCARNRVQRVFAVVVTN